jgi:hypothetical protein
VVPILWFLSCGGSYPVVPILWFLSCGSYPVVVPILWFLSCGSYPVVPILWFLSCGSYPVVPILWFLSCGSYPGGSYLWFVSYPVCFSSRVFPLKPYGFCLQELLLDFRLEDARLGFYTDFKRSILDADFERIALKRSGVDREKSV